MMIRHFAVAVLLSFVRAKSDVDSVEVDTAESAELKRELAGCPASMIHVGGVMEEPEADIDCRLPPIPEPGTGRLTTAQRDMLVQLATSRVNAVPAEQFAAPVTPEAVFAETSFEGRRAESMCAIIQHINGKIFVHMGLNSTMSGWSMARCNSHTDPRAKLHMDDSDGVLRTPAKHMGLRLFSLLHALGKLVRETPSLRARNFDFEYCASDNPHTLLPKTGIPIASWEGIPSRHFTTLTCQDSPALPVFEWSTFRHPLLNMWDRELENIKCHNLVHKRFWSGKEAKAVFRGTTGIHRAECHNFTHTGVRGYQTNAEGRIRSKETWLLSADNWKEIGSRPKLIVLQKERPDLLDISYTNLPYLRKTFKFNNYEYPGSEPRYLSMGEQFRRFKYNINVGRNVGWADRVRYLLLSPAAVLMQHAPCVEYWQSFTQPYVHYIPVDSNLDNLTAAVTWARFHDAHVQQIIDNAHELVSWVLSTEGVYVYFQALLQAYAARVTYPVVPLPTALEFVCSDSGHGCHYVGKDRNSSVFWDASGHTHVAK